MSNEKAYEIKPEDKGVRTYDVNSWDGFSTLFNSEFFTKKGDALNNKLYLCDYVWRGQRGTLDGLVSSFDREFKKDKNAFIYKPDRDTILKKHLTSFVYACRGKLQQFGLSVREIKQLLGSSNKEFKEYLEGYADIDGKQNAVVEALGGWINKGVLNLNHLWALGQHYGLKTPLLDWCYSPYVAAYFAFQEQRKKKDNQKYRIVWGLNYKQVCDNSKKAKKFNTGVDYFDPMSSEHPRLINQRGLFTITKNGEAIKKAKKNDIDIEGIVKNNTCTGCNGPWLIKLKITDRKKNREDFLRRLNAMNINHMSLFPEIKGAAEFSNIGLEFYEYARFHGQE